jgi:hypothetical protein
MTLVSVRPNGERADGMQRCRCHTPQFATVNGSSTHSRRSRDIAAPDSAPPDAGFRRCIDRLVVDAELDCPSTGRKACSAQVREVHASAWTARFRKRGTDGQGGLIVGLGDEDYLGRDHRRQGVSARTAEPRDAAK